MSQKFSNAQGGWGMGATCLSAERNGGKGKPLVPMRLKFVGKVK